MAIKVACPGCKSRYQVADRFGGQSTQCTKCQATIAIPVTAGAAAGASAVRQAQQGGAATATMTRAATAVAPVANDWMNELPDSAAGGLPQPAGPQGRPAGAPLPPAVRKKKAAEEPTAKEDLLFKLLLGNMALNVALVFAVMVLLLRGSGTTPAVAAAPTVAAAIPPTITPVQQPVPVQQPAVVQQPIVQQPVLQPVVPVVPQPEPAQLATTAGFRLQGNGSSFVNPMMQTWVSVYAPPAGGSVSYQSTGSGKGIDNAINKVSHFGCSDAPLTPAQLELAKGRGGEVLHIPLAMGAVVAGYNLPDSPQLKFTGPLLADIYLGQIQRWNDPAIAAVNPGIALPDLQIDVVYRSDKSGTTFLWTDYLAKVSIPWKQQVGVGTDVKFPCGEGRPQNEGVANHVRRTVGSIGYFELGFALANRLRYAAIQNRAGQFIEPSLQSTTAAAAGLTQIPADLCFSLTDTEGAGAYPICGAVWAIFYVQQPPGQGEALLSFIRWVTHEGQAHCRDLNYAPLAESVVAEIDKKLAAVQVR